MAKFILVYLGGEHPSDPEEQKRHFEKYMEWLHGLGNAVISPANPFKKTVTLKPDTSVSEGSTTAMSGYTILEADSLEEALDMSKSCPFLEIGGTLEVSELAEMPHSK